MMNRFIFMTMISLIAIPNTFALQSWERPSQPPLSGPLTSLAVHPFDPSKIIVASTHEIFEGSQDRGTWKNLWQVQGMNREIQRIVYFKEIPNAIFILTKDGAWKGDLNDQRWTEIYQGKNSRDKSVLSFAVLPEDPHHWFLGTEGGLYESDDAGKTWFRFERFSEREPIPVLRFSGGRLFIATNDRLYVSDDLMTFKPVFSLTAAGSIEESILEEKTETVPDSTLESLASFAHLRELIVSGEDCQILWLATNKGVLESRDCGGHWGPLPVSGLKNVEIQYLAFAQKIQKLFAGTPDGIYSYQPQKRTWEELFQGLADPHPKGLAVIEGPKTWLVAVTADGFVRYPVTPEEIISSEIWIPSPERMSLFHELMRLEPSARDTHKAVVRYGNLSQWKIKRWQVESRMASLLPTFSFGRDFSRHNNVDLDRAGTLEPDEFIIGPDDTSEGWDMNVNWHFSDFIWSSNQTSIDSREKLMVELRNDLLADATRVYYERRRLQMELAFSPAPSEREHFEKLIRLDELTSLLDSMTDGLFTQRLAEIYAQHPQLNQLWDYPQSQKSPNITNTN